jgi:hypothetical protein
MSETPQKRAPGRPRKLAAVPSPPSKAVVQYRVVKNVEHPVLQQTLDGMAADGWRLHTFTPALAGYLCVFERPV